MRCPYYIKMDGFAELAKASDVNISMEGIEALAEICEMFGEELLKSTKNSGCLEVGSEDLRKELNKLGFDVIKSDKVKRIFENLIKK
jgi:hypothetical protein